MHSFEFHQPKTLAEAARLVSGTPDAELIAGGMSLIPVMKLQLAKPSAVVDLSLIPGLQGIKREGNAIVIGAMSRHVDIESSDLVKHALPALARLVGEIGDQAIRNRGTIGGSIAANDPAADYPAAVLALNATIITNTREIQADDFFRGMFETTLERGEIITAISFPIPDRAAYVKFPNVTSHYAIVGVFVAEIGSRIRVAVTGAGPCVFRASDMEAALVQSFSPDALKNMPISADGFISDIHATPNYRAHLVGVMARRAVAAAEQG